MRRNPYQDERDKVRAERIAAWQRFTRGEAAHEEERIADQERQARLAKNAALILGGMVSFLGVLFVGYLYALKKGAFDWTR